MRNRKNALFLVCLFLVFSCGRKENTGDFRVESRNELDEKASKNIESLGVWAHIAGIDGGDNIAKEHVKGIFKKYNIDYTFRGGNIYSIYVKKDKIKESKYALLENMKGGDYYVKFADGTIYSKIENWKELKIEGKYADVKNKGDLYAESGLMQILNEPYLVQRVKGLPYIGKYNFNKRSYMSPDGNRKIAYDVKIELWEQPSPDKKKDKWLIIEYQLIQDRTIIKGAYGPDVVVPNNVG